MYVFAYGSLMQPDSLRRSLPDIDLSQCRPAVLTAYTRCFGIAFPNDGSQPDKAYFDSKGERPEIVLLCDVVSDAGAWTNGVCLPVNAAQLDALRDRERRYDLIDVTESVEAYPSISPLIGAVGVFTGKAEFTKPAEIARGVLSSAYLETVRAGARHWDQAAPGFEQAFVNTTQLPPLERIQRLRLDDS